MTARTEARDGLFSELYALRAEKARLLEVLKRAVQWDLQRPATAWEVPEWVREARDLIDMLEG